MSGYQYNEFLNGRCKIKNRNFRNLTIFVNDKLAKIFIKI